jgi:hypothetical protein
MVHPRSCCAWARLRSDRDNRSRMKLRKARLPGFRGASATDAPRESLGLRDSMAHRVTDCDRRERPRPSEASPQFRLLDREMVRWSDLDSRSRGAQNERTSIFGTPSRWRLTKVRKCTRFCLSMLFGPKRPWETTKSLALRASDVTDIVFARCGKPRRGAHKPWPTARLSASYCHLA